MIFAKLFINLQAKEILNAARNLYITDICLQICFKFPKRQEWFALWNIRLLFSLIKKIAYRKQSWAPFFPRGSKVAFKTQKSQIFDVFFDLRSIIYRTVAYLLNLFFIGIGPTTYFGPINRVFVFGKPYDPKVLTDFTLKDIHFSPLHFTFHNYGWQNGIEK